ncbi:MAG: hypothetical protein KME03_00395 [Aphanocapsa lilacina HA4352-LM1]|jgi:hypothetical protein|nr:hypothetical protein [Aphanocapsa lilacina HA4352-LM1]
MKPLESPSFDVQELKQYFFGDIQPMEEFDLDAMRQRFEELLSLDTAR